jgi:Holliday junction DNA helicase RuvB
MPTLPLVPINKGKSMPNYPASSETLRPANLEEFVGQKELKKHLHIILESSRLRQSPPRHLLFSGPPGLGKTTLAAIVAHELQMPLVTTTAPAIARPMDLIGLFFSRRVPSVIFIDEIHRLNAKLEELLYPAMEDGVIDYNPGDTMSAPTRMPLTPFTLVGATTQEGQLSAPLRERFGSTFQLRPYTDEDLTLIVQRSASLLSLSIEEDGAELIAKRSQQTPRIANSLLYNIRDWALVKNVPILNLESTTEALEYFGIDELGLNTTAREILTALIDIFGGGPVGAHSLASAVNQHVTTLEAFEPFLLKQGLITRTPGGRKATPQTYAYLHRDIPNNFLPI